jgi:hypothetical protein
MAIVNTQMLELILLQGDAGKPEWYTRVMTAEVQRRRALRAKPTVSEPESGEQSK